MQQFEVDASGWRFTNIRLETTWLHDQCCEEQKLAKLSNDEIQDLWLPMPKHH